jgi:hypothetical protein
MYTEASVGDESSWEEETVDEGPVPEAAASSNTKGREEAPINDSPSPHINTEPTAAANSNNIHHHPGTNSINHPATTVNRKVTPQPLEPVNMVNFAPNAKKESSPKRGGGIKRNDVVEKGKQTRLIDAAERRDKKREEMRQKMLLKSAVFNQAQENNNHGDQTAESFNAIADNNKNLPLDANSPIGSCFAKAAAEDIHQVDFENTDDL